MQRGQQGTGRVLRSAQPTHPAIANSAFAFVAFPTPLVPGQKYPAGVELLNKTKLRGTCGSSTTAS